MSKLEIIIPTKVKGNDKIIALIGPTGCGKSNFIDRLTKSTTWSSSNLRPAARGVRAVRIQPFNKSVVLVDTPGFDDRYRADVAILELIGEWLKKTYESKIELTGILYLHRITDNRMVEMAYRNLRMFGKLCGDNPAEKVIFVTTMWDKISLDKGAQREAELCKNYWRPMLELGAKTDRFLQNDTACAQNIVKRLLDSSTRATLLQEETVDKKRAIVETEAAKTLYIQMQTLLSLHEETLAQLREAAKRTNNPQVLADLQKEGARIQAELDKTFRDARNLKIPLSRRIMLFFSSKAKARAIDFP